MSNFDLSVLSYSNFPVQLPVGRAPQAYLSELGDTAHAASLGNLNIEVKAPLTREVVRTIARSSKVTALAKYACIMAWLGQRMDHFRASSQSSDLEALMVTLHESNNGQQTEAAISHKASHHIPGLGIAFYTALFFFLHPTPEAYVLNQWTATNPCLLSYPHAVRVSPVEQNDFPRAHDLPIPQAWEDFCLRVDQTHQLLCSLVHGAALEGAVVAMLDQREPDAS